MNDETGDLAPTTEGEWGSPTLLVSAADLGLMLTGRRRRFAELVVTNPSISAVDAAIASGYSPVSAAGEGSALMKNPKVLAYIGALFRENVGPVEALKFDVVRRLHAIASHDPRRAMTVKTVNLVTETDEGAKVVPTPVLVVKDSAQWDEQTAMAVSEVVAHGGRVGVRFYDKLAALGALAKIVKLVESGGPKTLAAQVKSEGADGSVTEMRVVYVEGHVDSAEGLVG